MQVSVISRARNAVGAICDLLASTAGTRTLALQTSRCLSSLPTVILQPTNEQKQEPKQEEQQVAAGKTIINRNPRNLEMMGIAWKRKGWKFQHPTREFYHRLIFERSNRHTTAHVVHCSGSVVLSASTMELAIARHLYSLSDLSAALNIGRVLAQRCLQSGITSMILHTSPGIDEKSEKLEAFRCAMLAGGVELSEPEEYVPDYEPGIDYSDPEALDNIYQRQTLAYNVSEESAHLAHLQDKRRRYGRRRPKTKPYVLQQPSYSSV